AMSLGTPVLAMSTGSIGEIIEDGKNGWIVKNGDCEGFIRKLDYIVSNRKILDEVSREASRSMEERFGKRNYIEGIKEMYKELYNRKGIPT
nr:glycosyltransferase [Clostridia bacterium]